MSRFRLANIAAQLVVDTAKVVACKVLLLAAGATLEHHLVKHFIVLLGIAGGDLSEIHRLRCQGVVKVASPLLDGNAARFAVAALRYVRVRLVVWNGESFSHDG